MQLEHVNRRGQRYYIFQGKTKTGKPKYFASRKASSEKGERIDSLPEDFEIFESPSNATVTVRRRKSSRVLPAERELVERLALELSAYSVIQTIIDGDHVVIYTPDMDPMAASRVLELIFGPAAGKLSESTTQHGHYTAQMRFLLTEADPDDAGRRHWLAERYCHRSWLDDWIPIGSAASLEALVREYAPHLGRESFYELF